MVQGKDSPARARPLLSAPRSGSGQDHRVQRLETAELVETFLASRRSCAPETRWHDRQVLRRFQRAFPTLPWDPGQVARFLLELPQIPRPGWGLGVMSMRSYHKVLRTFYAWARAEREPRLPTLPSESFGRRQRRR